MPKRGKASAEEKIRIVEAYLSGKAGYTDSHEKAGVDGETLRRWVSRYRTEGPSGFYRRSETAVTAKRRSWQPCWITLRGKEASGKSVSSIESAPAVSLRIG